MKKVLLGAGVTALLGVLTVFGQGNFVFTTGAGFVWNPVNPPVRGGPFNVGFLWSANLSATSLLVSTTGISHIPTNGLAPYFSFLDAWNALLTDPNFHFGRNASAGNEIAVATLTLTGGITYNGGSPFGVTGTSTGGGNVMIFFVAWPNLYATPSAAAAAGSILGWSNPFLYAYANNTTVPLGMGTQSVNDGVDARFGFPIPEPAIIALVGLGAIAMLMFSRRK